MSADNIDLVRSLYDAFGRGDVPAVLGAFDTEIEWHEADGMPYGGVHKGPEAVAANVFGPITEDVADFAIATEQFFGADDEVVMLGRYRGRGSKSGAELDIPVAHTWTIRDGKVVRFRNFVDTVMFREALAGQPVS